MSACIVIPLWLKHWTLLLIADERCLNESNGSDTDVDEASHQQRPVSSGLKRPSPSPVSSTSSGCNQTGASSNKEGGVKMMKKKSRMDEGSKMRSSYNCEELRYVQCTLETKELWDKFHDLETEMIITKTGR